MIHADYLFLLTDVDRLYTSNPRKDPSAKPIDVVSSISAIRAEGMMHIPDNWHPLTISTVSTTTLGSSLGTGGMETKLIAADIATAAGVTTIITSSKDPTSILRIIEYNNALKSGTSTPLRQNSRRASPAPGEVAAETTPTLPSSIIRPPHTLFKPSPTPLRDLKSWTSHTLHPAGSVIIDSGAHQVLSRRESGGRLLAAGVLGVRGAFASGQAVRIFVRRSRAPDKPETALEAARARESYLDGAETEPSTPLLPASQSLSSSISTIDGMLGAPLAALGDNDTTPSATLKTLPEEDHVLLGHEKDDSADWDVEEVGRGLANYNSAQIARVRGLKRCVPSRRSSKVPDSL